MSIANFPGTDNTISPRSSVVIRAAGATGTYSLKLTERVFVSDATAAFTLNLPPVGEAAGLIYYIKRRGATGTISVRDRGDDPDFSNVSVDGTPEAVIAISSGINWFVLASSA